MIDMNKPLLVFSAPVATVSGYGDRSRDFLRALIELDKFDIKVIPTMWGNTPQNALSEDSELDRKFISLFLNEPLQRQPDIYISCTIPNEFQPLGKFNIGITAGIETTAISPEWIEGCNRMNLVIVPSVHSKNVLLSTSYDVVDKQTNQPAGTLRVTSPVEIVFEGIDTDVYQKLSELSASENIVKTVDSIPEDFCYLFVGHWLNGDFTHDRKDVGGLIKTFFDAFKNTENLPALILKCSGGNFSLKDRESILSKIKSIRSIYKDDVLPNIYLLHGDLTRDELNLLYNHPKVKYMVSFTKGEGFGRPLLEFATTGKPIIVSGWSGHVDFIDKFKHTLLTGEVRQIHPSVVWDKVLIRDSGWFYVNYELATQTLIDSFKKYKEFKYKALDSEKPITKNWSLSAMKERIDSVFSTFIKEQPTQMRVQLPKLKRVE